MAKEPEPVRQGGGRGGGRGRPRLRLEVLRTSLITPHMVRIVLGRGDIAAFTDNGHADHYVKLAFPQPEAEGGGEVVRTYTVRRYDAEAGELTIDFVHHGAEGTAGPWAAAARPGDELLLSGPGGKYSPLPRPEADWHLLAGDESALPAIGSALERMAPGTRAVALVEVAGPEEEQKLDSPADLDLVYLHRSHGQAPGEALEAAVRALDFPAGRVQAFVHGEATAVMKGLRPHLLKDRGLDRGLLSISGYWRRGDTEESFRRWKQQEAAAESAD
ncbi:siderophore-interacting protein [Phaeacidiphilus oryzae]|uniref:siderophore-interacting protein n=1 Tax=Phaeacidiphilus oryzae TaxID=348818 RepID=UPI00068AC150|nr:siderophore-interacting protein [Phaeacidiphilus oryzae]